MNSIKGFLAGIVSSASFGLMALFSVPIMKADIGVMSVLTYRFIIASVALAILLGIRRISFKLSLKDFCTLVVLALLNLAAAICLFWGYDNMPSGVVTTIHFLYPVVVTLIMFSMYGEKLPFLNLFAILIAIVGVAILSLGDVDGDMTFWGLVIVLLTAILYAVYIVYLNKSSVSDMDGMKITFYTVAISAVMLLIYNFGIGEMEYKPNLEKLSILEVTGLLILLALVPTIISNLALVMSVKYIGSTYTAALGAMEPVTAIIVGVLVFHEQLTLRSCLGIILILLSVTIIVMSGYIRKSLRKAMMRFKRDIVEN